MSYHQISRPELGIRREWQFPLPQVRTLDNGMTIWAYQLPGQYVLSMELVFDVALSDEPTGHEGVATLACVVPTRARWPTLAMHWPSALSRSRRIRGGAARWATRCGIDVAAPYADQAVDLLSEIVRIPAYEERDVERHRTLALTEIEQMRASSAPWPRWACDRPCGRPAPGMPCRAPERRRASPAWTRHRSGLP